MRPETLHAQSQQTIATFGIPPRGGDPDLVDYEHRIASGDAAVALAAGDVRRIGVDEFGGSGRVPKAGGAAATCAGGAPCDQLCGGY